MSTVVSTTAAEGSHNSMGCPWPMAQLWLWLPTLQPSTTPHCSVQGCSSSVPEVGNLQAAVHSSRSRTKSLCSGQPLYLRFPGKQFLLDTEKSPALGGEGGAWPPLHAVEATTCANFSQES